MVEKNINDIRELKYELEELLLIQIKRFEEESGVKVTGIRLSRSEISPLLGVYTEITID